MESSRDERLAWNFGDDRHERSNPEDSFHLVGISSYSKLTLYNIFDYRHQQDPAKTVTLSVSAEEFVGAI